MGQKDQVIAAVHIQRGDNFIIERLTEGPILQLGIPQSHQKAVFVAVHDLLSREHNVYKIPAKRPGKGFFQEAQVFLGLLLRHHAHRLIQIGDNLPASIDVAAINMADGALFRAKPAAQFAEFFLIHGPCLARTKFGADQTALVVIIS